MDIAIERIIDKPAGNRQVFTHHLLPIELIVVARTQPAIEVRYLIQEKPVLKRLGHDPLIAFHPVLHKPFVNPVESLRSPRSETAKARCFAVSHTPLPPDARRFPRLS